jgi:hypothetical protein
MFLLKKILLPIAITYPRGYGFAVAGTRAQLGPNHSQISKKRR